jgi:low affinity Fe/Cu permease
MEDPQKPFSLRVSDRLTSWVGSPTSIVIHTLFFVGIFGLEFFGVALEQILLILTTAVSLEAIYLAIFIQMTVNRHTESLHDVEEDIEELGEEVEDLGEDLEELGEEVEDIGEDIDKIQEDETQISLDNIQVDLQKLLSDIEALKKSSRPD